MAANVAGSPGWAMNPQENGPPVSPWGMTIYTQDGHARRWLEGDGVLADVDAAGRLVSDTLGRDERGEGVELYDALEAAKLPTNIYTSYPAEWPNLVDVSGVTDLPTVLIDRYTAAGGQGTALCGIFAEIRRVWATVDNSIFLWRSDKWDGSYTEYSGEEQAICAVGLAKPRKNVFIEAIQFLLVLATPVELVLLGVCCGSSADGRDEFEELTLQPLPEYTIPTDSVTMTHIAPTDDGRIFLGGRDGHLYELLYSSGQGWESRCRKVCHTGGLTNLLTRWVVPSVLRFSSQSPIIEIAVDEERQILYTRSEDCHIQVFDLGSSGDGRPKFVAEQCLTESQGHQWSNGRSSKKLNLVSIAPITTVESRVLHLVVVSADGRRFYLSTTPSWGRGGPPSSVADYARPSALRVAATRNAPQLGPVAPPNLSSWSAAPRAAVGIKVEYAHYASGLFMISDASLETSSRLLVGSRDLTIPPPLAGVPLTAAAVASPQSLRALREVASLVAVDGRTLAVSDVLPPRQVVDAVDAAVSGGRPGGGRSVGGRETQARRMWAMSELATQHALPRRRIVVMSTTGLMEVIINRPVDILLRLLEGNSSRPQLEDFFRRFGPGEAAAMCLLLASQLLPDEPDADSISAAVAEKAAEAFEDTRLVGVAQMQTGGSGTGASTSTNGGFNMGQLVQEVEPAFSGAHEGLCLCAARLLRPVWEYPVVSTRAGESGKSADSGVIVGCRLSMAALRALEGKVRPLEQFLRSRRNQRRGHYNRISNGLGWRGAGALDFSASGEGAANGGAAGGSANAWETPGPARGGIPASLPKRQRVPYSATDLTAMEVRGMECLRRLLRRSGEALTMLQLLGEHHIGRLALSLDESTRSQLRNLTFHQLVCTKEGDNVAVQLIAALMQYYVSADGQGSLEEISERLRKGCPSYFNEADQTFYQAASCLEKAAKMTDPSAQDSLAREALNLLSRVPESANLASVCKRFEDIRFYEAVVELPLRKARAVDPADDALNERLSDARRQTAAAARQECYRVVTDALRSLKRGVAGAGDGSAGRSGRPEYKSPLKPPAGAGALDDKRRGEYTRQILELSMRWPDRMFHEAMYRTMLDLGMENELVELSAPDVEGFLRGAGNFGPQGRLGSSDQGGAGASSSAGGGRQQVTMEQVRYLELLARYYSHRKQHAHAAHVLLRLAERRQPPGGPQQPGSITLKQRETYLSNAILQAKNHTRSTVGTAPWADGRDGSSDSNLLDLLEAKRTVLNFQQQTHDELAALANRLTSGSEAGSAGADPGSGPFPPGDAATREMQAQIIRERAEELTGDVRSITDLYNDYAVPFELWELCLEMLNFSEYARDVDNSIMQDLWGKLLKQALDVGGVAEACQRVQRVGKKLYAGSNTLPLEFLARELEVAANDWVASGKEAVGPDDVPRALIGACQDSPEPVLLVYDRLLSRTGTPFQLPTLRLRLLQSVLYVLRCWSAPLMEKPLEGGGSRQWTETPAGVEGGGVAAIRRATMRGVGVSLESPERRSASAELQGLRGTLSSYCNRYMAEVTRLHLDEAEPVADEFRKLEDDLQRPLEILHR